MGTRSDSCGKKCISLSSQSCKSIIRWGEGGVLYIYSVSCSWGHRDDLVSLRRGCSCLRQNFSGRLSSSCEELPVNKVLLSWAHFFSAPSPTIMGTFWAIISGDYFRSFEAPEITASKISGVHYYKKWKYTPAVRSKISSKLIFASCAWFFDRAHYYELCVLIKDIGQRLPLQLQCSYQGQHDDLSQSVRGNYKSRFWGGQNLTAVKGNVSFYQVNLVSRIFM